MLSMISHLRKCLYWIVCLINKFKQHSRYLEKLPLIFNTKYCCVLCRLLEVRGRLYELLTHCIPPEIIMKVT